jgi:hypothetical protein
MTSLLKSAHVVHDVDENKTFIEIMYSKYVPDEGYKTFVDYLNAQPIGDWTKIVSKKETVRYEKFLDTMIEKNLETRQKMALIMLENITGDMFVDIKTQIRIMNTIKILDPTFDPPFVNRRCSWQKQFVRDFCQDILPDVVERCTNEKRLDRFFSVLRLIELEL